MRLIKMPVNLKKLKTLINIKTILVVLLLIIIALARVNYHTITNRISKLRDFVTKKTFESKTYLIGFDQSMLGGGSGFAVKAKSGATYIITNAHICKSSANQKHLYVRTSKNAIFRKQILHIFTDTDLCIVEGLSGTEGLIVGQDPAIGESITILGYPQMGPLTVSRGKVLYFTEIESHAGIVFDPDDKNDVELFGLLQQYDPSIFDQTDIISPEQCDRLKYKIKQFTINSPLISVTVKVCVDYIDDAFYSDAKTRKGNSGSLVINSDGEVVGVVFAMDKHGNTFMITASKLSQVLSNY